MDNNLMEDDDFWDYLNDEDFEQCVLLEVTQNAQKLSAAENDGKNNIEKDRKSNKNHWLNGNSCDFSISKESNNSSKFPSKVERDEFTNKRKTFSGGTSFSYGNSVKNTPKKQNLYKPLQIASSSTSSCSGSLKQVTGSTKFCGEFGNAEKDAQNLSSDKESLQNQLQFLQKENDKLKEENFIKQGEVMNLRTEIKRKETILESERVGHCMTLEAAEKRGKEKSSKSLLDMEMKMKSLEREVDKLQGNILFKNQEVQELLSKCKRLEQKQDLIENSPKRRKIDTKLSPTKSSLNFASRFDFGDAKKAVKTVETQTENKEKHGRQLKHKYHSQRRLVNSSRKAFYFMSTCQSDVDSDLKAEGTPKQKQSTLIAQMISSHASSSSGNDPEILLVKQASNELENLMRKPKQGELLTANKSLGAETNKSTQLPSEAISWARVLSFATGSESNSLEGLQTLSRCLLAFAEERIPNIPALISVLSSMTAVANRCSKGTEDISDCVVNSLRECANHVTSEEMAQKFICALTAFLRFESFARKVCVNKLDKCLVRRVCQLFHNSGKFLAAPRLAKAFTLFVTKLLEQDPNSFHANKDCNCSLNLLFTFVTQLLRKADEIKTDTEWLRLCSSIRTLHLWQLKDPFWSDKTHHVTAYTALLSLIVRNAQSLKTKGILNQQTWDRLYDLT